VIYNIAYYYMSTSITLMGHNNNYYIQETNSLETPSGPYPVQTPIFPDILHPFISTSQM